MITRKLNPPADVLGAQRSDDLDENDPIDGSLSSLLADNNATSQETDAGSGIASHGTGGHHDGVANASFSDISTLANYLYYGYFVWDGESGRTHWWASPPVTVNISALTAAEQTLAISALNAYQEVANISFTFTTGAAQITYNHNGSGVAQTSWSYDGSNHMTSATIDISSDWSGGSTAIYSYNYQTYLHETGHALGLGHQGPYNNTATYGIDNVFANDTWQWSVMSYFSQDNYGGATYDYVITPEMADIYAMQYLYGAVATRTDNTTYGFNSTAGPLYNFALYVGTPAFTIYDSGGTDTLDASGYANAQTIDLRAGSWSSIGGYVNNIGIYTSTTIENAVGGSGNDTITGNSADNTLRGGGGNDAIDGAGGTDSAIFAGLRAAYTLTDLGGGSVRVSGPDGVDTLTSVERLVFDDQTITWPPTLPGSISINDVQITEGDSGAKLMTFTVTRSDGTAAFTVNFATSNNTALAGSDYVATSGVLNFASGVNAQTISVTINGDTIIEPNELFFVNLSGATNGATISDSQGIGTIIDDDRPPSDFNADGRSDFLWQSTGGAVSLWFMDGANFWPTDRLGGSGNPDWHAVSGRGDFNGDGKSDIVWQSTSTGAVSLWFMDGTNFSQTGLLGGNGNPDWHVAETGDFNGDGKSDLVWQNTTTGAVSLWFMDETNFSQTGLLGGNGNPDWHVAGTGDFNGDGKSDLVWQSTGGAVSLWFMDGTDFSQTGLLGGNGNPDWHVAGTGDFNSDGKSDLVWQSTGGGVSLWFMEGTNSFQTGLLGGNGNPDWHVIA